MALKLIRTKLDRVPPDAHLHDYAVHRNGEPIGRIYRVRAPGRPELAWSWSITASVDPSAEVSTSGTAADLEDAKAAFRANWQKWLRRKAKTGFDFRQG